MEFKAGTLEELSDTVRKQFKFVRWLKSVGLYNPHEAANTMCKLQAVWEVCGEPEEKEPK